MDVEIWLDDTCVAKYSLDEDKVYQASIWVLSGEALGNFSHVTTKTDNNIIELVFIIMDFYFDYLSNEE